MIASRSMNLNELMAGFAVGVLPSGIKVSGMASDSRLVKPGYLFFACRGTAQDGVGFIEDAEQRGAVAVVVDVAVEVSSTVPVVSVPELNCKLGHIAARFYANPSRHMVLIGITGTNGKTSCSHLLAQCLDHNENRCGIVGTMGNGFSEALESSNHTTPGAVELQSTLHGLQQRGAAYIAMEVSSHALEQYRTAGCEFSIAVFTNLSRDHLDYHGTMEAYGDAKLKLFKEVSLQAAVVNLDDDFAQRIVATVPSSVETIGVTLDSDKSITTDKHISGKILKRSLSGTTIAIQSSWGEAQFATHLFGEFNVSNVMLVLAVALQQGLLLEEAISRIQELHAPKGRLESFTAPGKPLVVVDYAHTPDALQKVLQTLHAHTAGELWVLFGCGGDRDTGKRPLMGEVAEQFADHLWITDDNPRTESSQKIIEDILSGIKQPEQVTVQPARETAIRNIIASAAANDIILIAGKGHEDYQIIGQQVLPFSDREIVSQVLKEVA